MNDIIYDYPKSSCCFEHKKYNCLDCIPTNLALCNCDKECYDETFSCNIEPKCKSGIQIINPQTIYNKIPCDFEPIECCDTYESIDPRLIDIPRGIHTKLDAPPMDSSLKLNTIYCDSKLNNYGKNYKTYADIDAGQIVYYNDKSLCSAYISPVFSTPSKVCGKIYKDPMGGINAEYERTPLYKPCEQDCPRWLSDSTYHREDITSKQMGSILDKDWNKRWGCC